MKKTSILSFLLLIAFIVKSQNYLYVGTKSYVSTDVWNFRLVDTSLGTSTIGVSVAKGSHGTGYILLSFKAPAGVVLSGNMYVYLPFNNIIKLSNLIANDRVNSHTKRLYSIDSVNYELMKYVRIETVRFSVLIRNNKEETFTAKNNINTFEHDSKTNMDWMNFGVPTERDIKRLDD
ncbi:MAG: hypothetical protein Q8L07_11485 [Sediminibacterium sp.]|nr:hypothetical protein [Sediminibacterium sp.]